MIPEVFFWKIRIFRFGVCCYDRVGKGRAFWSRGWVIGGRALLCEGVVCLLMIRGVMGLLLGIDFTSLVLMMGWQYQYSIFTLIFLSLIFSLMSFLSSLQFWTNMSHCTSTIPKPEICNHYLTTKTALYFYTNFNQKHSSFEPHSSSSKRASYAHYWPTASSSAAN